jgi:glycolate oxidase FAD binding subunit
LSDIFHPSTPEELCERLAGAAAAKRTIELFGANTKRLMAGLPAAGSTQISTSRLNRIIQYEPRDLTISVEAGMPFAELSRELASHGQMIPLEGAWSDEATIGGMIAANINGSRRRLYGAARDLVIGMKFATLDGKLVQSGGMVVKNVAGLDMAKLMIGSFGTLAAIASINFKLIPIPAASRTLLFDCADLKAAMEVRDAAIRSFLNPAAVDIINPVLAAQLNLKGFVVALLFAGNDAVVSRSTREAEKLAAVRSLPPEEEQKFWTSLRQITPRHLEKFKDGAVVKISTTLSDCGAALESAEGAALAHAASGITRVWFSRPDAASRFLTASVKKGWKCVVEFSGESARRNLTLWPEPGGDFAIMKNIKRMFDPQGLLNTGRLFNLL